MKSWLCVELDELQLDALAALLVSLGIPEESIVITDSLDLGDSIIDNEPLESLATTSGTQL